jgi:NAD(P)-dependent dehydrogenase (short-subunit alcohol dehydrogenase family)
VVTGASSGIGAHAAARLAERGWSVAVVGRNRERTDSVAASVGGRAFYVDYDSFASVRSLATELLDALPSIDALVNNAGGLVSPRSISADGNERTLQHNHLSPFLLTALLRERLESCNARVVSTASVMNRVGALRLDDLDWSKRSWSGGWQAYGTAKLATVMFMSELARRSSLEAYSVHPGYVSTGFGSDSRLVRLSGVLRKGGFGIPVSEGAVPLVMLTDTEHVPAANGSYFDRLTPNGAVGRQARDRALASALWERTATLVGI